MTGPDPNSIYPNENIRQVVYIENVITRPNILVGDYTYYDDIDGAEKFEEHVTHHYDFLGDRLIIVSDSLRCAGLCDGRYNLGGLPMIVRDGRATLLDGTIAGSSSNLLQELRNVVSYGVPLEAAVKAMTETPAKDIGVFDSIGSLEVSKCADFLVLNKDLKLMATFIDGKLVNGTTDFESVK